MAGAGHLAAEGQGEVAVWKALAGEGGIVDFVLQAVRKDCGLESRAAQRTMSIGLQSFEPPKLF